MFKPLTTMQRLFTGISLESEPEGTLRRQYVAIMKVKSWDRSKETATFVAQTMIGEWSHQFSKRRDCS